MSSDVIAIDGPAASGKSSIAKKLSEALFVPYVSTGSMYRAVAWKAMQSGFDIDKISGKDLLPILNSLELRYAKNAEGRHELQVNGNFMDSIHFTVTNYFSFIRR